MISSAENKFNELVNLYNIVADEEMQRNSYILDLLEMKIIYKDVINNNNFDIKKAYVITSLFGVVLTSTIVDFNVDYHISNDIIDFAVFSSGFAFPIALIATIIKRTMATIQNSNLKDAHKEILKEYLELERKLNWDKRKLYTLSIDIFDKYYKELSKEQIDYINSILELHYIESSNEYLKKLNK